MAEGKVNINTVGFDNWQKKKTLQECNQHLLEYGVASDVKFVVGITDDNRKTFKAHKFVLSSRSCVFYNMFNGDGGNKDTDNVIVTDVDPRGFDALLRYIYYDKIDITENNAFHVLEASVKYQIDNLEEKALEYISTCQVAEKICGVLDQAVFYHKEDLINQCLLKYSLKPDTALKSDSFTTISYRTLLKLLRTENVPLTESVLFEACEKWATEECKRRNLKLSGISKRQCLEEALYYIRFPLMSLDYFANTVSMKEILSDEEELSTFRYLAKKDKAIASKHLVFSKDARGNGYLVSQCSSVARFDNGNVGCSYQNGTFNLNIKTNENVDICGFRSENVKHSDQYTLNIECDGKKLHSCKLNALKDGVFLDSFFRLNKCVKRTITFRLHNGSGLTPAFPTQGGNAGKQTVTSKDNVTFTFDQPNNAGFIADILYFIPKCTL